MQRPATPLAVPPPFFIAIGASGSRGLKDMRSLLAELPADLPAVVLLVLHRPSDHVSRLAQVLARSARMPVSVAADDEFLQEGHCYVGEPNAHLALAARSQIRLVEGTNQKHRNRTVDILFKSLAAHAKSRGVGVVLSGSLDDGSRGLAEIHHAGGVTMVLSADGQIERGMPLSASAYDGPIDFVGSAQEIAAAIVQRVNAIEAEQA
jgi:two-component system chemotaxis response regulator CheB